MVVNIVTVVIMTVAIVTVVIVKVEIMTGVIVTIVKLTIVIVTIEIVTVVQGLGDLYFAKLQISQTRPDQKRTLFRTLSVMSTDFPRIFPLLLFFSSTI